MPAFAAVVAHKNLTFEHLAVMSDLCLDVQSQFPQLRESVVRTETLIAARFSLTHSAIQDFAFDNASQSWLCCIGNPRSNTIPGQGRPFAIALLDQYLKNGPACITSLHAPFVVVIYDSGKNAFHLVTDRVGLQHIYMTTINGATVFSTSALALASVTSAAFDQTSIAHYFSIGHLLEDRTLFQGIHKVSDATWLTIDRSGLKTTRYWNAPDEIHGVSQTELAEHLVDTFSRVVDQRLDCGCASVELTGGHDSRLNLVCALRSSRPFHTWTIAESGSSELAIINKLKAVADFQSQVISPITGLADSFVADLDQINTLTDGETNALNLIASITCNRFSNPPRLASISGMGGEILRGFYYITHLGIPSRSPSIYFDRLIALKMLSHIGFTPAIFSDFLPSGHYQLLRQSVQSYFDRTVGHSVFWRLDDFYFRARQQRFAGRSCSFNSYFYRTEIPFFDNDVIDISYCSPWQYKKNSKLVRHAINICNPACAAVDLLTGRPARPFRLADTSKLMTYYARLAQKALNRLQSHVFKSCSPISDPVGIQALIRSKLASPEVIGDLLSYNNMASSFLYDPRQFREFLVQNVMADFPNLYQFGLILSFELTCRRLRQTSHRIADRQSMHSDRQTVWKQT